MDPIARTEAEKLWNCTQEDERIPIWLDCDTGHDDAFAILLAAKCPKFSLLGVSTLHGNSSCDNTTKNSLSVLEAIGRRDVPVYRGATKPFCREAVYAPAYHGETGLDGTTLLPEPIQKAETGISAVEAMYQALINTPKGTAWLTATGALTNVALLLAVHPDIASHLGGLSIMGGAVGGFFTNAPMGMIKERVQLSKDLSKMLPGGLHDHPDMPIEEVAQMFHKLGIIQETNDRTNALLNEVRNYYGNWTPVAEFNIFLDPEAANCVFSNTELAGKTTLIPLDISHQVLADKDVLQMLAYGYENKTESKKPTTLRALFMEIITFFAFTYLKEAGMEAGPPLHDPIAVAAALAPGIFDDHDGERFEVDVVTEGENAVFRRRRDNRRPGQCGRTVVRAVEKGRPGVRIPRSLNTGVFWSFVDFALLGAEMTSPLA
ncbi:nucleoside hydrolase [Aulographum hederae CBS 113979]|uniref:Nucleoside hydrolase n=1 Tax=Aulographum hederae CBS 113979 TaxID=1176131 RepID=A0A6G1H0Y9_9PEZI|nr:nucleoside hydrolase [Aulographum hederae CBS 113979]